MHAYCYFCGTPLTTLEVVMAQFTPGYQCRHCWNRLRVVPGAGWPVARAASKRVPARPSRATAHPAKRRAA